MRETSSFGLVKTTRTPSRGRFCVQLSVFSSAHTLPTISTDGAWMLASRAFCGRSETVATTLRCTALVPSCRIAAGICGSIPAFTSPSQTISIEVTPIKKTSVPSNAHRAGKLIFSSPPFLLCAVMMWTDEQ